MMEAIFITARLKSTRLEKKVLLEVLGKTIIGYQIERLKKNIHQDIILTTSTNSDDDELVEEVLKYDIKVFRGSEEDVLLRYLEACDIFDISKFYIVYGDEPFLDIDAIKKNFEKLNVKKEMWISNGALVDGTFGYAMNYKAIKFANAFKTSNNNEVWGDMLARVGLPSIEIMKSKHDKSKTRLTIDYEEDFIVFQELIRTLGDSFYTASIDEIVDLYHRKNLYNLNGHRIRDYYNRINNQKLI